MIRLAALLLTLSGGSALAAPVELFGYVGVACGLDDPFDATDKTDYSDEVAGWTTANHVCLQGPPADWAAQITRANALYRPILSVEPAFLFGVGGPDSADAQALWTLVATAVRDSGVDPARMIFYLVDEPTLRGIDPAEVESAAARVAATFPTAEIMMIEAYRDAGPPPIPPSVTLWGFDAYTVRDPLAEPRYTATLFAAQAALREGQRLVLVLDANHTPVHAAAGLSQTDMADVALAYERLARSLPDLAGIIGYTWAGGIDNAQERGVRDMPAVVQDTHRAIARRLTKPMQRSTAGSARGKSAR
jgi:hypothetical protein